MFKYLCWLVGLIWFIFSNQLLIDTIQDLEMLNQSEIEQMELIHCLNVVNITCLVAALPMSALCYVECGHFFSASFLLIQLLNIGAVRKPLFSADGLLC